MTLATGFETAEMTVPRTRRQIGVVHNCLVLPIDLESGLLKVMRLITSPNGVVMLSMAHAGQT
jgi:hypothetical protein